MKIILIALIILLTIPGCDFAPKVQKVTLPFQCIPSQTACEVETSQGTFLVMFNTNKLVTELPFKIQVALKSTALDAEQESSSPSLSLAGYMEGKTMFMGKVPLFFTQDEQNKNNFITETMLGSCTEEHMEWRLWLTVGNKQAGKVTEQSTFFIDFTSTRY